MNKAILLFLALLLAACSNRTDKYCIKGRIGSGCDADTITLAYSPDGIVLKEMSGCAVKDGHFSFKGHIGSSGIGYICCKSECCSHCSLIFIEKGNIEIIIDSAGCIARGTPLNDLSNTVEDSIEYYINRLEIIEECYYSESAGSDELASLGAEGFNLQERLITYLRRTISDNIGNLFGLYMLVAYNDFFTTQELHSLMEKIPLSSIDRDNNPFYDIIIYIVAQRDAL